MQSIVTSVIAAVSCNQCDDGFYGVPPNCQPCACGNGSYVEFGCDSFGTCSCRDNYVGHKCDECRQGYYNYPHCMSCACDPRGSLSIRCDPQGQCACKDKFPGIGGKRCDECRDGFFNFPQCSDTQGIQRLEMPQKVKLGSNVQLSCVYGVGNSSFTLKWIHSYPVDLNMGTEERELYRYQQRAGEKPIKSVRHVKGINVEFDKSGDGKIYIKDVDQRAAGLYKCQITIEGSPQPFEYEKRLNVLGQRPIYIVDPNGGSSDDSANKSSIVMFALFLAFYHYIF